MKAITFQGIEQLAYETVPDPGLEAPTDAIVRVEATAICGSDLHPYHGREVGLDLGTVMGHEFVGEVVEAGTGVEGLEIGTQVVSPFSTSCGECFYCHVGLTARCETGQLFGWRENGDGLHGAQAEYVRVPLAATTLVEVPPGASAELALLAGDVLSTGFFSAEMAAVEAGSTVAVVGSGPVGLMAVVAARELEAERVFALDTVAERLELAERFGGVGIDFLAEDPLALVCGATAGRGADAVIEAVGSPAAVRMAVDLVRPGGTVAAPGVHTEERFAFAPAEVYDKNLTYRSGRCSARRYLKPSLATVTAGSYPLEALITHRLPLSAGVEAYQMFDRKRDGCVKVILRP